MGLATGPNTRLAKGGDFQMVMWRLPFGLWFALEGMLICMPKVVQMLVQLQIESEVLQKSGLWVGAQVDVLTET